jgi:NHL repeat
MSRWQLALSIRWGTSAFARRSGMTMLSSIADDAWSWMPRAITIVATLVLACAPGCGRLGFDEVRPDATGPDLTALELLAGDIGGAGNVDGTGAGARFSRPDSVAVDSAGNVYVADSARMGFS